ncbi:hypothetical protein BJ742DRAFT_736135 [Cladochytrium replicatum]|nr:hypothetical protein BJ742DRAFT_736135 [Cladochytrium replicatum]
MYKNRRHTSPKPDLDTPANVKNVVCESEEQHAEEEYVWKTVIHRIMRQDPFLKQSRNDQEQRDEIHHSTRTHGLSELGHITIGHFSSWRWEHYHQMPEPATQLRERQQPNGLFVKLIFTGKLSILAPVSFRIHSLLQSAEGNDEVGKRRRRKPGIHLKRKSLIRRSRRVVWGVRGGENGDIFLDALEDIMTIWAAENDGRGVPIKNWTAVVHTKDPILFLDVGYMTKDLIRKQEPLFKSSGGQRTLLQTSVMEIHHLQVQHHGSYGFWIISTGR